MGVRLLLCCVMMGLLTGRIAAQSMALTSEDPDALIKHLLQNGYRIDRRDGKTVWATLPSDKAQAMQAAVRTAEAAALSEAASATTAGAARGAHVRRAQAALAAARPFQQAAFDQLQALGLASKFEQSHRWVAAGSPVVLQAPNNCSRVHNCVQQLHYWSYAVLHLAAGGSLQKQKETAPPGAMQRSTVTGLPPELPLLPTHTSHHSHPLTNCTLLLLQVLPV
jgi:hypothetical protein